MTWLLIISVSLNGQSIEFPAGVLIDKATCEMAGAGVTYFLEEGTPGLVATYGCLATVEGDLL